MRRKSVLGLALVGAIAGLVFGLMIPNGTKPGIGPQLLSPIGKVEGPAPFPGAIRESNIHAAELALGWHFIRPNTCVASDARIRDIFVNPKSQQAFIRYEVVQTSTGCDGFDDGQLEVVLSVPTKIFSSTTTPTSLDEMTSEAVAEGPVASVRTVAGVPAVVLQGNYPGDCESPAPGEEGCVPAQQNPTAVRLQLGGLDIEVYGAPDWTTDQLVQIADSLA